MERIASEQNSSQHCSTNPGRAIVAERPKAERGMWSVESCCTIEGGLRQLFEMSGEERRSMGARGRALVEDRFTRPKVAAQMREVYEWVLGGGSPPEFVV